MGWVLLAAIVVYDIYSYVYAYEIMQKIYRRTAEDVNFNRER